MKPHRESKIDFESLKTQLVTATKEFLDSKQWYRAERTVNILRQLEDVETDRGYDDEESDEDEEGDEDDY